MSVFLFFFNDTATTEIYTYLTHSFPTRRSSDLKARNILERRMIFWSAELFVRAAGITAVGLLGAMAASIPASSPARAQDGPVVVNCFDEAHETVKRIPAKEDRKSTRLNSSN